MKYLSRFPSFFCISLFSFSAYSADLLTIAQDSDNLVNQTFEEMKNVAHEKALNNLYKNHTGKFVQVSAWQDSPVCKEWNSDNTVCRFGWVYTTASFVDEQKMTEDWFVTTAGMRLFNASELQFVDQYYKESFDAALGKALFYCNGDVLLPALNVKQSAGPWNYIYRAYTEAKFQCKKSTGAL